jgi:dethiobiotin synthetase
MSSFSPKPRGFFVTGTDTGVGKTLISCALLHALVARGERAVGMKPVAAGCTPEGRNEDVEALRAAGNVAAPAALVNPYRFTPPTAPHLAAAEIGTEIELDVIATAYRGLAALADVVIVEGVGGFCVPLNAREDTADLAVRLALPVLLVVGLRLGCLNHALLTAEAIRARGLRLAGWVANALTPEMDRRDSYISALQTRLSTPMVAWTPFASVLDARAFAPQFDLTRMA